jgi:hypothetical protein
MYSRFQVKWRMHYFNQNVCFFLTNVSVYTISTRKITSIINKYEVKDKKLVPVDNLEDGNYFYFPIFFLIIAKNWRIIIIIKNDYIYSLPVYDKVHIRFKKQKTFIAFLMFIQRRMSPYAINGIISKKNSCGYSILL